MKIFLVLLTLIPGIAFSDLLDRVRLEEALRTRLEQIVQTKDAKARVLARVDYQKFETELPGTSSRGNDFTPSRLELSDIAKLEIDVYTELADIDADTRKLLIESAHVPSNRVKLTVHNVQTPEAARRAVEAKDLSEIAEKSVSELTRETRFFLAGMFAMMLLAGAGVWWMAKRRMKEFKDQVILLANAISEGGGGGARMAPAPSASTPAFRASNSAGPSNERMLKEVPQQAVNELFADCYWTKNDGYAHWLWKNLDSDQRTQALSKLSFMSEYSLSFVSNIPVEQAHHEHPFYISPISCAHLSMIDVDAAVSKDLSIWHKLSPMRQMCSTLPLKSKVKAVATKPAAAFSWPSTPSTQRKLDSKVAFGQISSDDEAALFETPNLAPLELRGNIRSLVWLAQKDEAFIKSVLARFDARSLASAWVGPEVVLKKLEACVPEKKMKLLRMHLEREEPSRDSSVYDSLVQEGLRNEAA